MAGGEGETGNGAAAAAAAAASASPAPANPSHSTPLNAPAKVTLHDMRQSYTQSTLLESDIAKDPFSQFHSWFNTALDHAQSHPDFEPNAMSLSTVDISTGQPSSRIVLLKEMLLPTPESAPAPQGGFVFYTNYSSRKAAELERNPRAALLFHWGQRQIRIEGRVLKLPGEESDVYFGSRPRGSQIGAWSSPQSQILPGGRTQLESIVAENAAKFEGVEKVPRPEFWGGYVVVPEKVEFWQGRASRLHDRIVYEREKGGEDGKEADEWKVVRLAP